MAAAAAMFPARAASSFLPRLSSPTISSSTFASVYTRRLALPLLPRITLSIPAISLNLPSLPSLEEIWDGLLKAVPKKKVSHSKKRSRQMAGKALKDVTSLCRCPSCGEVKRMHVLCPTCLSRYGEMMASGVYKQELAAMTAKKAKTMQTQATRAAEEVKEEDKPNKE